MSANECCNSSATIHWPITNVVCGKQKFQRETTLRKLLAAPPSPAQDAFSDNNSSCANMWSADDHPKSYMLTSGFLRLSDVSAINAEIWLIGFWPADDMASQLLLCRICS